MISKKVPHTYIQEGIRYYALMRECKITTENGKNRVCSQLLHF